MPLIETVDRLAANYREAVSEHGDNNLRVAEFSLVSSEEAVDQAWKVLKRKKSAKASLEYLLQVLYPGAEIRLDN
jgi:hypothetical protein